MTCLNGPVLSIHSYHIKTLGKHSIRCYRLYACLYCDKTGIIPRLSFPLVDRVDKVDRVDRVDRVIDNLPYNRYRYLAIKVLLSLALEFKFHTLCKFALC